MEGDELLPEAPNEATSAVLSYEDALSACGCGSTQRLMLLLCGLGNAADAVELLSISLVLPALGPGAPPGGLSLSYSQLGVLSASLFWGAFVGTLVWGVLGDFLGRRKALAASMALSGAFGLLSASAGSFGTLILWRCLAGMGVGGSQPLCFAYLAELLPTANRGRYLCLASCCWMLGSLAAASAGLILVPRYPTNGWRVFLAVGSLPSLACGALTAALAPESPRWLLARGRPAEALSELRKVAARNGNVKALHPDCQLAPPAGATAGGSIVATTLAALRSLTGSALGRTVGSMALVWFGISYGWYGVVAWLPELFAAQQSAAGPTSPDGAAGLPVLDAKPFFDQLAVSFSNLPGNLVSLWMIDASGRRRTLSVSLVASSLCAALFAFATGSGSSGVPLAAACAFNAASVGGWNALEAFSAELMPTRVRTTGMALLSASGRLGSVAVSLANSALLPLRIWAPLVPSAAALLLSAVCVQALVPYETAGRSLADTAEEHGEGGEAGGLHQQDQDEESEGATLLGGRGAL